jgi:hypothetical protein
MRGRFTAVAIALLISATLVVACGNGNDEVQDEDRVRQEVETRVREAVTAFNQQDMNRFLTYWTDRGLQSEFEMSRQDLAALADVFFAQTPDDGIELRDVRATDVRANRANADVEFIFGQVIAPQRYILIRQDNQWLIDDTQPLSAEIPDATQEIEVELDEFGFSFDANQIESGDIGFVLENAGDQPHEALLLSVPEGYTLEQLIEQLMAGVPEGVTVVGGVGPYAPGSGGNMVLAAPLQPGTYMFVCFMPDQDSEEDVPHAALGMGSVFQVP